APAAPGRASRPPTPARPGAAETFREAPDAVTAPGQLASHYAPGAALRLEAAEPAPDEAWLGFGAEPAGAADGGRPALNLSPSGDLGEAAASLFAHLRALDARMSGRGTIAVAPIPAEGLGLALRDRLARAAAPRTRSETER
ncbi:MAG: Sua5 family C-terminal domain-containing protein, partial [Pseudomonadota bacterium]